MMKYITSVLGSIFFLVTLPICAGTFLETFDNLNLKDWKEVSERNFPVGEWRIVNGTLHAESKDDAIRMLVVKNAAWHDYEVELDVMPLVRHGRGHIVLAARVNQSRAIVFAIGNIFWNAPSPIVSGVVLNLPLGRIEGLPLFLARVEEWINGRGEEEIVAEVLEVGGMMRCTTVLPHPFLKRKEWNHLRLRVDQEKFTLWVNGELVLPFTCPFGNFAFQEDLTVGSVGFGIAGYTARFDNLKITGEEIQNLGGLLVQPQSKLAVTWGQLKQRRR